MSQPFSDLNPRRICEGALDLACIGRPYDWTLRGDEPSPNQAVIQNLEALARRMDVQRLLIPAPTEFNKLVARPNDFKVQWGKRGLFRGVKADGVVLERAGDACAIASADCPTIIAHHRRTGMVVVAHGGLKSLCDHEALAHGTELRRPFSVVETVLQQLMEPGSESSDSVRPNISEIRVVIVCGISQKFYRFDWRDPHYGSQNQRLCRFFEAQGVSCVAGDKISLPNVITRQFAHFGALPGTVTCDSIDTYGDRDAAGQPIWHSHRRAVHDKRPAGRNLVLVRRRS